MPVTVVEPEARFPAAPRFLVTVVAAGSESPLQEVLASLARTDVVVDESRLALDLSIEGSFSFHFGQVSLFAGVVRASQAVTSERVEGLESSTAAIRERVRSDLDSTLGAEFKGGIWKAEVESFRAREDRLFGERQRFGWYQFTASGLNAVRALAGVAAAVSGELGRRRLPIAYLYFPTATGGPEGTKALRIGVRLPDRVADALEVDFCLNDLAAANHVNFFKGGRHEHWGLSAMEEIARYEEPMPFASTDPGPVAGVELIWARGPARAGFVAQMLDCGGAEDLLGGSMAVLAGTTIACWILPRSRGGKFAVGLRKCLVEEADTDVRQYPLDLDDVYLEDWMAEPAWWLTWECKDEAGVFSALVNQLTALVMRETGEPPKYRYSVSRVQATGETCAGSLRFYAALDDLHRCDPKLIKNELIDALPRKARRGAKIGLSLGQIDQQPWATTRVD